MPTDLTSLEALMDAADRAGTGGIDELPVSQIHRDPDQPRQTFSEERLRELAASIQAQGVVQPLVVRQVGPDQYRLIAGERRWRAAQMAAVTTVPVVIRDLDFSQIIAVQLVENLDREDLSIIEESLAVVRLIRESELKPSQVAKLLGKSPSWVSQRRKIGEHHRITAPFIDSDSTRDPETLSLLVDLQRLDEEAFSRFSKSMRVQRAAVRAAIEEAKDKKAKMLDEHKEEDVAQPQDTTSESGAIEPPVPATTDAADHDGLTAPDQDSVAIPKGRDGDGGVPSGRNPEPRPTPTASPAMPGTPPGDDGAGDCPATSATDLRDAQEWLRRLLQLGVDVSADEGGGAVVRIRCDTKAQLRALVERLM